MVFRRFREEDSGEQPSSQGFGEQQPWGDGDFVERVVGSIAAQHTRRSFLGRVGTWLVGLTGVSVLTSLPLNRAFASNHTIQYNGTDPRQCNYWRNCNLSGRLCADCPNGGMTTCPPGSELGAEFWYGCCEDPTSGKTYMIAYQDCCGLSGCGRNCTSYDQREPYNSQVGSQTNDVLWCQTTANQSYTCTLVPIVAEECTPWQNRP